MQKLTSTIRLFLFLIIILSNYSKSIDNHDYYVNPGVRIGYIFGGGFTWNTEVTFGLLNRTYYYPLFHYSIAIGYQSLPVESKGSFYAAVQGGITILGLSKGITVYKNKNEIIFGKRNAIYLGITPVIVSYDVFILPEDSVKYHSVGAWGKIPILDPEAGWGS